MAKVNSCRRCRKLFESNVYKDTCPECEKELEKKFKEVRTYVRRHQGAGLYLVSEACDVPVKQLQAWLREERLTFDEESEVALPCLGCGALIRSGKYCDNCKVKLKREMTKEVSEAMAAKEKLDGEKVSFRSASYKMKENR